MYCALECVLKVSYLVVPTSDWLWWYQLVFYADSWVSRALLKQDNGVASITPDLSAFLSIPAIFQAFQSQLRSYRNIPVQWNLLALSGGHPVAVFGEWNGETLLLLTVFNEQLAGSVEQL